MSILTQRDPLPHPLTPSSFQRKEPGRPFSRAIFQNNVCNCRYQKKCRRLLQNWSHQYPLVFRKLPKDQTNAPDSVHGVSLCPLPPEEGARYRSVRGLHARDRYPGPDPRHQSWKQGFLTRPGSEYLIDTDDNPASFVNPWGTYLKEVRFLKSGCQQMPVPYQ
jgi:hypothetical protein